MTADQSVRFLKGVGERRAAQFEKLGIATLRDLVRHFPREYEDWSQPTPLPWARNAVCGRSSPPWYPPIRCAAV